MARTRMNSGVLNPSMTGAVLIALHVFSSPPPMAASCSVTQQGSFTMLHTALDLEIAGTYLYVVEHGYMLRVVDVSDPLFPTEEGSYLGSFYNLDVAISGGLAYLADQQGLVVLNISDPQNPVALGSWMGAHMSKSVAHSGNHAFLLSDSNGLRVFDVSDPYNPTVEWWDPTLVGIEITVFGDHLAMAAGSDLRIIDVSTPTSPATVGTLPATVSIQQVAVSGGIAYVLDNSGMTLRTVDLASPAAPTELGSVTLTGNGIDVSVNNGIAYVAQGSPGSGANGLSLVEVSDPMNPVEVAQVPAPYSVAVTATDGLAFLGESYVHVFDVSDCDSLFMDGFENGTTLAWSSEAP